MTVGRNHAVCLLRLPHPFVCLHGSCLELKSHGSGAKREEEGRGGKRRGEESGRTGKLWFKGTQTQLAAVLSLPLSKVAEAKEQQDLQRKQRWKLSVDGPLALLLGQQ